jgi:hypothetical protein
MENRGVLTHPLLFRKSYVSSEKTNRVTPLALHKFISMTGAPLVTRHASGGPGRACLAEGGP